MAPDTKTAAKGAALVHHLYTNPAKFPVVPQCCWCAYSAYLWDFATIAYNPKCNDSFS
jgi:hypothetical protein